MSAKVVLIRGINVGGKNKVSMAGLTDLLEQLGCTQVRTLLNSGNAVVHGGPAAGALQAKLEKALPTEFAVDDELLKVLVLTSAQFHAVIEGRPAGFGDEPTVYHSDAIFLMGGVSVDDAMKVFTPREEVDAVWPGVGVIYHRRLSARRTQSRLGKIVGTPVYKSMTIRSWQTTRKLADLVSSDE